MFTTYERVGVSRTGANGKLKLAEAVNMLQDCSVQWMDAEPSFRDYLTGHGMGMFLTSRQTDLLRLPDYKEQLTITTTIFDCKGLLGYRNTVLYGEDGAPCILTWSTGAFVSMDTGSAARLPKEEISKITYAPKVEMEYLPKKIALPNADEQRLTPIPVRRSDIDLYNHMNNAKYLEAALECLPEGFAYNRLRLEYRRPAAQGDILFPRRIGGMRGPMYISLENANGIPYCVVEFSQSKSLPVL